MKNFALGALLIVASLIPIGVTQVAFAPPSNAACTSVARGTLVWGKGEVSVVGYVDCRRSNWVKACTVVMYSVVAGDFPRKSNCVSLPRGTSDSAWTSGSIKCAPGLYYGWLYILDANNKIAFQKFSKKVDGTSGCRASGTSKF